MSRLIQDFRMELWGFDAILEDGTYAFAIFADTVILNTRHGFVMTRGFPPEGRPWGNVRRVGGRAITCAMDRPEVAFGSSYFLRGQDQVTAVLEMTDTLSFTYRGPFLPHSPAEPVWEEGARVIRWDVPLLRAPVEVRMESEQASWVKHGEGIHAYLFADFNPFRVPLRHLAVGHLQGDNGTVFYAQARHRDGSTTLHVARQQGPGLDVLLATGSAVTLAAEGPILDSSVGNLRPQQGRYILSGSPLSLIDGLPGWIRALADQITLGIEMAEWVGTATLDGPAGPISGDLVHTQLLWP